MAALANAAFAAMLAQRDGVSVGGPDVGNGALKERTRQPPQGPAGVALRARKKEPLKKLPSGSAITSARKIQDPDKRARAENSAQWGLLITYNGLGQHDKAMQSLEASLRAKEISEIPEPRHANQAYMSSEFLLTSYWCA